MNYLKNIQLNISFPFASFVNVNTQDEIFIYSETLKAISKVEFKEWLLHCDYESGTWYIPTVDKLLCSKQNSRLYYPSFELIYNDKFIDHLDISLLVDIDCKKIILECIYEKMVVLHKVNDPILKYKDNPPCKLGNLKIKLFGDLKYCDIENREKQFSLLH